MNPNYKCNKCLTQWYTRVPTPIKCPRCTSRKIEPIKEVSISMPEPVKETERKKQLIKFNEDLF